MRHNNYRTYDKEQYFNSLDFTLENDLREDYHEVRYFDDFLDNLDKILAENKDTIYFYTGWNYKPVKELQSNNRYKKYGICKYENNENLNIPIYIYLYEKFNKSYASVNRKSDKIIISINTAKNNKNLLRYLLEHELTHVVCDYSEENFANLNSLKNSISYDENIFNLNMSSFEKIMRYLYWINKSEQDAKISATLKYIREKREANAEKQIDYEATVKYIKETYELNQLNLFKADYENISHLTDKEIYILGYYMQMHHYFTNILNREFVNNAIKTNLYDKNILNDVINTYSFRYKEYKAKLFNYIARQKIIFKE